MNIDQIFEQALTLHRDGKFAEAERAYRQILAQAPRHAGALHYLGVIAHQFGHHQQAAELIRQSIALAPVAPAYANLGEIFRMMGKFAEAEATIRHAVALEPNDAHAHNNLAAVLRDQRRFEESLAECRIAEKLDPASSQTQHGLMNVLGDLGEVEAAMEAGRKAVQLGPEQPMLWHDLGCAMVEAGQFEEAVKAVEHGRALSAAEVGDANVPATFPFSLANMRFLVGDYAKAFREYEARWQMSSFPSPRRHFSQPRWDGSPQPAEKTVLLYGEQGAGDQIMFARYVPLCAQRARVIVECQRELLPLMKTLKADVAEYRAYGDELPPFDFQVPFLSIPALLGTTVETIPANVPYLWADDARAAAWREKLQRESPNELRVGLAWAGRPSHPNDHNRSMKLAELAPLAKCEGVAFVSLQIGPASAEAANPPSGMKLLDWTGEIRDYADTAALVNELDLLVSIDTSVVHVAGALAKKVWTLLPFAPDWRWLASRPDDTPWYPTMRLFRQMRPKDWAEVVQRVAGELGRFAT